MSADEESLEDHVLPGASPSLEIFGGEGAASEQEASGSLGPFQMAVWSLLHDARSEPQIEDEPQDFLQESILDEEQERTWYSQAEDTEVKKSSSTWDAVSSQEMELPNPLHQALWKSFVDCQVDPIESV